MTTLWEPAGWLAVRLVENRKVMGGGVGEDFAAELGDPVLDPQPATPALRISTATDHGDAVLTYQGLTSD